MKKIMLVAAAAVAGQLMAESLVSDIVGFKKDATKDDAGFSLMTSSFATPKDDDAKFSLADLSVSGYAANCCYGGEFILNVLSKAGRICACYYWIDDGTVEAGWYNDMFGNGKTDASAVSFSPASALWITGSGYQLVTAGLVNKKDINFVTPDGSDYCGVANGTAADLTFDDLVVIADYAAPTYNEEDDEWTGGITGGKFSMQKLDGYGRAVSTYYYIDDGYHTAGWYKDTRGTDPLDSANVKFTSGDGFLTKGSGRTLRIPAPSL